MRILIADDEPLVTRTLRNFLAMSGHDATGTYSAQEAMDVLSESAGAIDILITDIQMPQTDGMELLHEVRSRFPEVNVILITGYSGTLSTREALEQGACAYLRKPIQLLELEALLEQIKAYRATRHDIVHLRDQIRNEQELRSTMIRDQQVLLRLKRQLLPRDFSWLSGTKVYYRHLPLSVIGGDVLDVRRYGEDQVLLLVADVSGHGIPATFGSIAIKTSLVSLPVGLTPRRILIHIERSLAATLPEEYFATVFCGLYNESSRELRYTLAGHPPPYLLSTDASVRPLTGDGTPLCFGPPQPRQEESVTLEIGETLIAYTDGLAADLGQTLDCSATGQCGDGADCQPGDLAGLARRLLDCTTQKNPLRAFADDLTILLLSPALAPTAQTETPTEGLLVGLWKLPDETAREMKVALRRGGYRPHRLNFRDDMGKKPAEMPRVVLTYLPDGTPAAPLIEQIQAICAAADIIAVTDDGQKEACRQALRAGAAACLERSADADDVLTTIQDVLRVSQSQGEIAFDGYQDSTMDWMEFVITSSPEVLPLLERYLRSLGHQPIPPHHLEDVLYCIREIAANAIEWGNLNCSNKRVRISTWVLPDKVVIKVSDEGAGFPVRDALRTPFSPEHPEKRERDGKRPGGFGLTIVQSKMDELRFNAAGNEVQMTKYFGPSEAPANEKHTEKQTV